MRFRGVIPDTSIILLIVTVQIVNGFFSGEELPQNGETLPQKDQASDPSLLEQQLALSVNKFKMNLQKTLEESRIRSKRSTSYSIQFDSIRGFEEERVMIKDLQQVSNPLPASHDLSEITAWTSIEGKDAFFLVWGREDGSLRLGQFNGPFGETVIRQKYSDSKYQGFIPYKIKYFIESQFLWLVVAYTDRKPRSKIFIVVYQVNGTVFQSRQTIDGESGADIDIYQDQRDIYLTVGDSSGVRVMPWLSATQFDQSAKTMLTGVKAVRIMKIASDIFVATVQYDPDVPHKSQLLVYKPKSLREGAVQTHQYLETKYNDYRKVSFFKVGSSEYLIYVGVEKATIYWWVGDAFLEYQTLDKSEHAKDVFPLRLVDGEVLLAVMFDSKISFYTQAVDHQFVEVYSKSFDGKSVELQGLHLSTYANKFLYAFIAYQRLKSSPDSIISPVWKIRLIPYFQPHEGSSEDELFSCLSSLGGDLKARDGKLRSLAQKADRVWVKDRPQVISAPVIVEGSVKVNGVAKIRNIIITTNSSSVPQVTSSQIHQRLGSLQESVGHVVRDLPNLARKDRSNVIRGKVTFSYPVIANRVSIHQISNPDVVINGLPVNDLKNNILTVDKEQVISGKWTFAAGLKAESMFVGGTVNSVSMADVLLKHSNTTQVISGKISFRNLTIDSRTSLPPTGTINGILLNDIVTTKSPGVQVIHGVKTMGSVRVQNNFEVAGQTNGRHLKDLAEKAVKLNSPVPQVIRGNIIYNSPEVHFHDLQINGLINNVVNFTHMQKFAVSKTKPGQVITGRKTFHGRVSVQGNLDVSGRVNGLNFPDELVTVNKAQDILTPFIFKSSARFTGNVDTLTVNAIDLSEEAVLKSSHLPQVINSKKGFLKGITVREDITMDPASTLDSVDPSELAKIITMRNNVTLNGPLIFQDVVVNGSVFAREGVNGYAISDLPNIVWLKSANQTINHPVTFLSPVHVISLATKSLNDLKVPDDFVMQTNTAEQTVMAPKTFLGDVFLPNNGLTTNKGVKINGIDIDFVNQELVRNLPTANGSTDDIFGVKTFDRITVTGNVYANKINGLDLKKDVMINNLKQDVRSPLVFVSDETEVQDVFDVEGDINVSGYVNGFKFSDWAKDVVRVASPVKRPIHRKKFKNLRAHSVVAAGTINGISLENFKKRVVTLDTDQVITGRKNFLGGMFFDGDLKVDSLNGINVTDLETRVIRRDQVTIVRGNKMIRGRLIMEDSDLDVKGFINDVNLKKLAADAVYKNRNNIISAPMTFASGAQIDDLRVKGRLDGVSVEDLVFLDQPNTIFVPLSFEDDVTIEGQLLAEDGSINGCNLQKLMSESVRLDVASAVIKGKKTFTNLDIDRDLNVTGPINGVNLPLLASQVVTLDSPQIITGPIVFLDTVTVDNLFVMSNISGINVRHIMTDAVRKSIPQKIRGGKVFIQDVVVQGGLTSFGNIDVKGFFNGVNITLLDETVVKKTGSQQISGKKTFTSDVVFEKDVTVSGLIGPAQQMLRIPHDLVLLNRPGDVVPGEVIFKNTSVVRRNLNVAGFVDGINLSEFMSKKISLKTDQSLPGKFEFKEPVFADHLIVRKTINGIPVQDIVTKTGNHVLHGLYKFVGGIEVAKDLMLDPAATINDVSVEDIARRSMDIRKGGHLSGRTVLANAVELGSQGLNTGKLNGLSVRGVVADFVNTSSRITKKLQEFGGKVSAHESRITSQLKRLESHSTTLDYFDIFFEFSKDSKGKQIKMNKFLLVPNNNLYSYGNSSVEYLEYPVADKIIYWKLRGYHASDESCPVYGSMVISHEQSEFREVSDFKRPLQAVFGMKSVDPFYIWLNNSDCSRQMQVLLTDMTHKRDSLETSPLFAFPPRESSTLIDARGFTCGDQDFVVVSFGHKYSPQDKSVSVVFRFERTSNTFVIHQEIKTFAPSSLDLIQVNHLGEKQVFLAVANRLVVSGIRSPSFLYFWNKDKKVFQQLQLLNTWSPSSVKFVSTHETTYLLVANEKAKLYGGECESSGDTEFGDTYASFFTQHVNVYELTKRGRFDMVQSLNIPGVTSLDVIHLPPKGVYLLAASKTLGKTVILHHRGINRFQEITSFSSPGVIDVKAFWSRDGQLFLGVASINEGQSKVLRAVLSGPSPKLRRSTPFASVSVVNQKP